MRGQTTYPIKNLNNADTKKIIFIIITMFSVLHIEAQVHLNFLQIPIDGTIESFGERLTKKDFIKSKYSDVTFTGNFYNVICSTELEKDSKNNKVHAVKVRYNQSMTGLSKQGIINLYRNIAVGIKDKYKSAKMTVKGDVVLFSLSNGYILCNIYETAFGTMGGGINIEIHYVDKANTTNYKLPSIKSPSDDL